MKGYSGKTMQLDGDVQAVLEYAANEARKLGHAQAGTAHLLLGIMAVAPTRLDVKNLPDGFEGLIRERLGQGDTSVEYTGLSDEATRVIKEGELVYQDEDLWVTGSSCLLRKVIYKLFTDWRRDKLPGYDFASELLQNVPNQPLLRAYAEFEWEHTLNSAMNRLTMNNRLKFLDEVLNSEWYGSGVNGPVSAIEQLVVVCCRQIQDEKRSVSRCEGEALQAGRDLDRYTEQLLSKQKDLKAAEQSVARLGAIIEPEAADAELEFLEKQKTELLSDVSGLQARVRNCSAKRETQNKNAVSHQSAAKDLQNLVDLLQRSLTKAEEEGRKTLLAELKQLAIDEPLA
ncbi:MAG: hypothetical protein K2Y22_06170 [Candidatus Obscuribacterales bacterium]|nr:hypothetical protein [Candidatus Obscuribacterales bacterium]